MPRPIHFEIPADEPERAIEFYKNVFGWEIKKWDNPEVDYWMIMTGPENAPGGINGGLMKRMEPAATGGPNAFVCTMDVPSLDEYVASVTEHGGKIEKPKMAVPGVGYMAYCSDTEGNAFGLMEMDEEAR